MKLRSFTLLSWLAVVTVILAACGGAAPAAPTTAPAKPTEATKPAASPAAAALPAAAASPVASPGAAASPAVAASPGASASPAASSSASPVASPAAAVPASGGNTQTFTQGQFAGKTLNVALAPGRIDDLNRLVVPEFERLTGAKVQLTGARSSDQVARARIEKDRPTLDVLWIDIGEAEILGKEGVVRKVTETDLPNMSAIRENARVASGIAPVAFSSALGFLYNKELVKQPPTSWADLWDRRFDSQLALFDTGSTLGIMTLVIAARLNGGGEQNIDPGFTKMVQLKPNAFGWKSSGPENNNLVAQGEAGVTLALANQTLDLQKNGAPVDWVVPSEGAGTLPQSFQLVAGSPEPELARAFANYVLGTEVQTKFANELLLAVTNRNVVLDPAVASLVPLDRLIYFDWDTIGFDWDTIGARRGEWTNRFNREILES